jgi:hypothetical protein
LAGGFLTGKYKRGGNAKPDTRAGSEKALYQSISEEYADSDRNWDTIDTVVRIAKEIGVPPVHVALSWIADRPSVVAPIVGARTVEHLRSNLGAAELILDKDATETLEKVSRPQPGGYPYGLFGQWQRGRALQDGNDAPPSPAVGSYEYPGKENQRMTTNTLDPEPAGFNVGSYLRDGAVRLRIHRLRVHVSQPFQQIVYSSRRMIAYSMSAHERARHECSEWS